MAKKMQFSTLKQEEEWRCDEFYDEYENKSKEKPREKHLNNCSEDDEKNSVPSNCMAMRNFFMAQGVTDTDAMDFDREIRDMMESVRNLQAALSEDARVGDIFREKTTGEEQGIGKSAHGEENVKASFEEIEKMDAMLRVKVAEERKAKLCRIQAEEESRDILSKLPCARESNVIKLNLEEFMRLLNDLGETEGDLPGFQSPDQTEGEGAGEKNKDNSRAGKKMESRNGEERKAKHLKFVEKNIQLAKCGRGTLSMTDEEKQRIEELLMEAEDLLPPHQSTALPGASKGTYAIDEETKSILTRIDQRLETVAKTKNAERSGSKVSLSEKQGKEENICEKNNSEKKKKGNRLAEINKLLNAANSVTHEEITPLSEEEIGSLVKESRQSLDEEEREGTEGRKMAPVEGAAGTDGERSEDLISELVATAKQLMPKFKYRFVDS